MNKNIYGDRCQLVSECFKRGDSPEKVLIVPIDMAKAEHTAMMCRGTGEYLHRKPLRVYNSPEGSDFLVDKVKAMMRTEMIYLPEEIRFFSSQCSQEFSAV